MKKRSLFAAVAMLLVSAIMLTSATYAWFASSNRATVDKISAEVNEESGSLLLVATGTNAINTTPTNALDDTYYQYITDTLRPITVDFGNNQSTVAPGFYKVKYDGSVFTSDSVKSPYSTDGKGDYIAYSFDVVYSSSTARQADAKLKPTLEFSNTMNFGYVLIRVAPSNDNTTYTNYVYSRAADHYYPVTNVTGKIVDNKTANSGVAGIVDDTYDTAFGGDTTNNHFTLGNQVISTTAPSAGITVIPAGAAADTTHTAHVQVYIWAEGNDENCVGSASSLEAGVSFVVE